jgi:glutamine cyclotransferase
MSDGSSRLTFRDRTTFEPIGGVEVLRAGEPVERINELECVEDLVYANVWQTEEIVIIDPGTGRVVGRIDASPLLDRLGSTDGIDVLNGIAYDPADRSFYLTGKLWPEIFQVRLPLTTDH